MVVTNFAKAKMGLFLGGSHTTFPSYFMIGNGSGAASVTDVILVNAVDRQAVTNTTFPLTQKTSYQGDWNSVEMSGIQLQQLGVIESGTGTTGSQWSVVSLPPLTFDGTNELRIEETWEVF